jgi:hypothetical protein
MNTQEFKKKIPYDLAEELKMFGFDWKSDDCTASFYAQVIDWFEEKHKIKITTEHVNSTGGWCSLLWIYDTPNTIGKWTKINIIQTFQNKYDALNNSIKEAKKLIENYEKNI